MGVLEPMQYAWKVKHSIYYYYTLIKPHHPPIFNILSLIFIFFLINFPTYCYTLSNFFYPFYLFISPLLSTLISHLLYPFIFLDFLLFLFPSSYYKFTILFSILFIIFFTHKRLFLSHFFFFHFWEGFLNIFFLYLYFMLMNFCIIWNSTLG